MDATVSTSIPEEAADNPRLAILLAMAMFVLVVDTSMMNVSISAVVKDLDTTVEWRPVGDRARGAGLRRLHPDQQQNRRPHRPQTGLRDGSARLCRRRADDDAHAEPAPGHHLLGDLRRDRRVAPPARHAVVDPRELRGEGAGEGLRARGGGRRHCRRGRTAPRRIHHDLPVVAGRLPAGGRHHRDRALRHQAW